MTPSESSAAAPFVSIILPVRNEGPFIDANLERLLAQDYPADKFEILIVDGRSTDDTWARAELWAKRDNRVRLLDNPRQFVANGLNLALAECQGELICWVDGHMLLDRDYLAVGVQLLAEHPEAWCVGGPIMHAGRGPIGRAVAIAQSHPFGVGNARHRYEHYEGYGEAAINPIYRRWIFEQIGNFDEQLVRNQDDEYGYRIRQAGGRVFISYRMRSLYFVRESFTQLFRQYAQYAFWRIPMLKKYGRPTHLRQLIPPLFYALMVVLAVIGGILGNWLVAVGLPAVYLLCLLVAGWATWTRRQGTPALLVPLAFLTMHGGYAYGYWKGFLAAICWPAAWDPDSNMAKLTR